VSDDDADPMAPPPGTKPITLDELLGVPDVERVLKRLTRHAEGIEQMSATEVQAAKIVLGKKMPDVKAIEVSGKGGGAIKIEGALRFVEPTQ